MPPSKLNKAVMDKIKEGKVKPEPKWHFLLRSGALWTLFGGTIILGGLATSITIFMLSTAGWEAREHLDQGLVEFMLSSLPYVWLGAVVLLVAVGYYNLRHTDKGYKYRVSVVATVVLMSSFVLGLAFFSSGLAKVIENQVLQRIPYYERLEHQRQQALWAQPEKGLLAGTILKIDFEDGGDEDQGELELEDLDGDEWVLIINEESKLPPIALLVGMRIRAVGQAMYGENTSVREFVVEGIHPWERNFKPGLRGPLPAGNRPMMQEGEAQPNELEPNGERPPRPEDGMPLPPPR